jgi:large conductance mechanosensitive channel
VINKILAFLIVAAVIFFLVVKPLNILIERAKRNPDPVDPTTKKCPHCLSEIPLAATRCAFCTSEIGAGAAA